MKIVLTLFILISTLFATQTKTLEKVSLQLHWKYQFEYAGFIAAKEKGFYKDEGLDVELKEYEFGMDIEADVLSGKSEYAIYNSLSLLEYLRGKDLVLVSSFFKRAALVLVTTPDIKSPKDLVGKKIMASTKEDFKLNYQAYFDHYGVDIDDVILVPHSYGVDEFAKGEVSAMTAFVSNELCKLDEKHISYNVLDPSDENLFVLQLELMTSKKEAQKHPERVAAFKRASLKGWEYALTHKEELANIIYNKYSDKYSVEMIMQEAMGVEKLILPYTYEIGSIDSSFLKKQMELFVRKYKIESDKKLDDFIFESKYRENIHFTSEELSYLADADDISLCIRYDKFPVDGYENGEYIGIMADIYKKISKRTSLEFTIVEATQKQGIDANVAQNRCKLVSVMGTQSKRFKDVTPTNPFMTLHFTLISTLDKPFVTYSEMLQSKLLLTQEEAFKEYLLSVYPFLNIKVVEDKDKMIQMLLNEEAYAMATIDEQVDYLIEEFGYGKLKINGFIAKENPIDISIGVKSDETLLLSILNKALKSISQDEISTIVNNWKITRFHNIVDYTVVYWLMFFMSIVVLIMLYYSKKQRNFNKKLEKLVAQKTEALTKMNESLEETVAQKVDELIKKDEILTLQSKQAVMGEMISMIAHQWRQPLNTITLNISNLQIKQMLDHEIDENLLNKTLTEITETIVYLSETVDDFKTYFHPDKKRNLVDINELLQKSINFVLPRMKSNSIEIHIDKTAEIKIYVYQNELIQVLLNIFNNAIDAYENITLSKKFINVDVKEIDSMLYIYIKDRAGGITKENLKKLFEPYFSTKGKNGTGLGLYMSQMIIQKQFGGELKVEVVKDSSTFIIKFPISLHA